MKLMPGPMFETGLPVRYSVLALIALESWGADNPSMRWRTALAAVVAPSCVASASSDPVLAGLALCWFVHECGFTASSNTI
jgi:hypothetical protein